MGLSKIKNQLNIYKEFWKLANQADNLAATNNYDVDKLIEAWQHQLTASNFFYGSLVNKEPSHNANKVYYSLKSEPKEHQLVYAQIGRGYSKELFDPHWCYVLKHCGTKLIVIPLTSLKEDSGTPTVPYEYDILESGNVTGRMHFDDVRCIDKMRIVERKGYIDILTDRSEIERAFIQFLNFSQNNIDKSE